MIKNEVVACLKVAASVCGKDGLISEAEEEKMFQIISNKFAEIDRENFETILDDFFESENHIEDYLAQIDDLELRKFTLKLSKDSSSVDGLDFRENIALQKIFLIWGMEIIE